MCPGSHSRAVGEVQNFPEGHSKQLKKVQNKDVIFVF